MRQAGQRHPISHPDPATEIDLQRQLDNVWAASKQTLLTTYRELFGREPPTAFGPDLLRRTIAYRLQENVYGGLSKQLRRELDRLVKQFMAKPDVPLKTGRQAQPGAELVRNWKGECHRVLIAEDGFVYAGATYGSLSEIARKITGTRWNGPRFFGLRRTSSAEPALLSAKGKRSESLQKLTIRPRVIHGL
jgi:hypothetical protein